MFQKILDTLPYRSSFRFVDELISVTNDHIEGSFRFPKNAFFYEDHFFDFPVTPGVILIEVMAQIGVVCFGIYLSQTSAIPIKGLPLLNSSQVDFYKMVLPEEKVFVYAQKKYFRLGKLKCEIEMRNERQELIAKGILSGMLKEITQP